jgi:hypothetical protein
LNLAENDVLRQSINYRRGLFNLHFDDGRTLGGAGHYAQLSCVTRVRNILSI